MSHESAHASMISTLSKYGVRVSTSVRLLLVALAVVSSGILGTFLVSSDVSATQVNNNSTNPNDWLPQVKAQRWAYVTALDSCTDTGRAADWNTSLLSGLSSREVKEADVVSGTWFATSRGPEGAAGYIGTSPGSDGRITCNEIVKLVMSAYSIGGLELYCSLGGTRDDGSDCLGSRTGSGFNPDALNRMNVTATWGTALPTSAGAAAYYKLNQAALERGCNVGGSPVTTSDNFTYDVTRVDDFTGEITTVKLRGIERSETVNMYTTHGLNQLNISCADIASELAKNANAYAEWVRAYEPTEEDIPAAGGTGDGTPSNCAITGIGWIVCPVSRGVAAFVGAMFNILELFLAVPSLSAETDGPLYSAWSVMRNIANVVFVIVFMLVIYSQMTGGGKR